MRLDNLSADQTEYINMNQDEINQNIEYQSSTYLAQKKKSKKKRQHNNPDSYNLTNFEISKQYGINNYERALIVISTVVLCDFIYYMIYMDSFEFYFKIIFLIELGNCAIMFALLLIIYLKLKKGLITTIIPSLAISLLDILSVTFFTLLVLTTILINFQNIEYISGRFICFLILLISSIYFVLLILKIFNYLHCSYIIQTFLKRTWYYITYYILCLEEDSQQDNYYTEYQEYDDFDSEY